MRAPRAGYMRLNGCLAVQIISTLVGFLVSFAFSSHV